MWLGFCCVDVLALPEPGSPKFQLQEVGLSVDVSVKATLSGAVPLVGAALNAAVGAVPTLTYAVRVFVSVPVASVTVSFTV